MLYACAVIDEAASLRGSNSLRTRLAAGSPHFSLGGVSAIAYWFSTFEASSHILKPEKSDKNICVTPY
jgi:hypothetical protein